MTNPNSVTPDSWMQSIQELFLTPYVKPQQVVLDNESVQQFEDFDTRAKAHAVARGEHDAMIYLSIYAIWVNSWWRARCDSWEDYCDEWDKMPFGVSKSSIKHKIADIRKLLALGVTVDTIIRSLGLIPMATRALVEAAVMENEEGALVEREGVLPEGRTAEQYLAEAAELGPVQANMAVNELRGATIVFVSEAEYDQATQRLIFKVVQNRNDGNEEAELYIPAVPEWAGQVLVRKLMRSGR